MKYFRLLILPAFIIFTSCTKKKPDPTPSIATTTTTGTTSSTSGSTNSGTTSGATTSSGTTTGSTTSSGTNTASFNDGTNTTVASVIQAEKNANTGHITISMIKIANQFPTTYISIASPTSTGTYKDDQSPNTYGQIKYSSTDTYTTDFNVGGTCTINVTELTNSKVAGNFTFTGKNSSSSATKTVTGSFNCPYTTK